MSSPSPRTAPPRGGYPWLGLLLGAAAFTALGAWIGSRMHEGAAPGDLASGDNDATPLRTPPSSERVPDEHEAGGERPSVKSATTLPSAPAGTRARRFTVCGREESAARLEELRLAKGTLWSVHCGPTAHLIALDLEGDQIVARRYAQLRMPSPAREHAPRPAPLLALDLTGDGQSTVLAATLRSDQSGAPVGGAIFRIPTLADGSLGIGTRLHDAAPSVLRAATFDARPGRDFVLLTLGDARAAQGNELWQMTGGPAPLRTAKRSAPAGTNAIEVSDLDGDGTDDLAALVEKDARMLFWLAAKPAEEPPLQLEVQGASELASIELDLDGDGETKPTLLALGSHAQAIGWTQAGAPEAQPVPELNGLRDLHRVDINADGREDVIGYASPELAAVVVQADGTRERRRLAALHGDVGVLQARVTHLDADGRWDLVVLAQSEGHDPQVELVVVPLGNAGRELPVAVELPTLTSPLRDAPFHREIELR